MLECGSVKKIIEIRVCVHIFDVFHLLFNLKTCTIINFVYNFNANLIHIEYYEFSRRATSNHLLTPTTYHVSPLSVNGRHLLKINCAFVLIQ